MKGSQIEISEVEGCAWFLWGACLTSPATAAVAAEFGRHPGLTEELLDKYIIKYIYFELVEKY